MNEFYDWGAGFGLRANGITQNGILENIQLLRSLEQYVKMELFMTTLYTPVVWWL